MDKSFEKLYTMPREVGSLKNLFSPILVRWQYDGAVLPSESKIGMHPGLPEKIPDSVFPVL
jgi:hypothetical protein